MEFILLLLVVFLGPYLFGLVLQGGASATKSAVRAAQGKGSFSENMTAQWEGMGPLELRQAEFRVGENEEGTPAIGLEIRGLIPVSRAVNLGFVTSVIDVTEKGNPAVVLSEIEAFQEPTTTAWSFVQNGGRAEPDQGFISWVRVGLVIPDLLIPPHAGVRKLLLAVRLVDTDHMPNIELGFSDSDQPGILLTRSLEYRFDYSGKGYQEAVQDADEARSLAIRLAMAIAIADGSLDDSEGNVIKEWVKKAIAPFTGSRLETLKSLYNDAMRDAYADANADSLSLSEATSRLNEIGEPAQKYEAIELCFAVMAADGVADEAEMDTIRRIAEALELDYQEIETLRDKSLIDLDIQADHQASPETLIGIQDGWSEAQIKEHIRVEFSKWNGRLNNLPEGQERENAQRMLDLLADARKRYG